MKELVQKPVEVIEKKIEDSRSKRKSNKLSAYKIGCELYQNTQGSLALIKSILGNSDLKYISISDKLSDEILQCGIDYFKLYKETDTDPSTDTADLFRKAKLLAIGKIAKQRCQENTENLQEWIDEKPTRDKQNKIKIDLEVLLDILEEYDDADETIANANELISRCKTKLLNIKGILGSTDELYLKISTRVASQAQSYVINEFNHAQDFTMKKIETLFTREQKVVYFELLKTKLREALAAIVLIGALDMTSEFKTNSYNKNAETIRGLSSQFGISPAGSSSNPSNYSRPSTTQYSSKTSSSTSDEFPDWAKWIIGIVIFIILLKACN
ncbi:MAG: hypothetical protein EOO43_23660 [Flavobacterium sp.]|nr:MAG: hypothetical protein EOO43_23660 [Flavobacterium sp.]